MNFPIFNIICSAFALFVYVNFRLGVDSYLRVNKNSKTYIRKNKKGYSNFWLYKKINDEVGLGYIFYLNIFLLSLTLVYSFMSVCFCRIESFQLPIAICNILLVIAQVPAIIFADIYSNLECYKKRFVILAKISRSGSGLHSSFYAVIEVLGLLAFAIYNVLSTV